MIFARRLNRVLIALPCVCLVISAAPSKVQQLLAQVETTQPSSEETSGVALSARLIPEGTRIIAQTATCRIVGERLLLKFGRENRQLENREFVAIENLAAQRIFDLTRGDPVTSTWVVTGIITEHRGRNYLQIQHSVRSEVASLPTLSK